MKDANVKTKRARPQVRVEMCPHGIIQGILMFRGVLSLKVRRMRHVEAGARSIMSVGYTVGRGLLRYLWNPPDVMFHALRVVLMSLPVVSGCQQNASDESVVERAYDFSFIPEYVIGADETGDVEGLLVAPQCAAVIETEIFVSDLAPGVVRTYTRDSGFRRIIGSPGQGPGEFQQVGCLWVNSGHIYVTDGMTRRVSKFGLDGRFISAFQYDGGVSRVIMDPVRPEIAILTFRGQGVADSTDLMLHAFDVNSGVRRQSFGSVTQIWKDSDVQDHGSFNPGYLTFLSDSVLLYSPGTYYGHIFRFRRNSGMWRLEHEVKGAVSVDGATATRNPESRGLHKMEDGRIIHFVRLYDASREPLIAELYSATGEFVGSGPVRGIPLPEREFWDFYVQVLSLHSNGEAVVLAANEAGAPSVVIGRLVIEDASNVPRVSDHFKSGRIRSATTTFQRPI